MLDFALMFLASAVLSFILAYPLRTIALKLGVVDHPERRKMHQIPIPLMGGVSIAVAFVLVSALFIGLGRIALEEESWESYVGLLAGAALILALGLYDDARGLKPQVKLAGQVVAAMVVVAMGARMDAFTNPLGDSFHLGWLGVPLTIFWIVGVTNAVNLIDGLDGLAVGIASIAALGLFAIAAVPNPFVASLMAILAGAGFGFLPHNFYPARVFLGDAGSMFLGFSLGVIALHGSMKATTATVLFLPIVVLGIPIFDTVFAFFRRARRRVSPFKADREHIHHRLVRIGLHHRKVVLVLYFVCAYLALTAYSIAQFPYQTAFLFLVLLTMAGIIGLRTLRFLEERIETDLARVEAQIKPAAENTASGGRAESPVERTARRQSAFTTLACELGDLQGASYDSRRVEEVCSEVRSMLSRRLRVHAVIAEPTSVGKLLLIVRTDPLEAGMRTLVQNGISWYFQDQRERFSSNPGFPAIRWIKVGDGTETTEDVAEALVLPIRLPATGG